MDLPTQRDTDDSIPTPTPDTDLVSSDLDSAAEHAAADDTSPATDVEGTPLDELSDEERAALHARWDAEVDTVKHVDPHKVLLAENVRTDNAEADEETTANFKTHGVKTAANGHRDYDTGAIVVTEGQRRVLNREAGCTVPVWMKTPPTADERFHVPAAIVNRVNSALTLTRRGHSTAYHLERGTSPVHLDRPDPLRCLRPAAGLALEPQATDLPLQGASSLRQRRMATGGGRFELTYDGPVSRSRFAIRGVILCPRT
jgi:hypothetical protein